MNKLSNFGAFILTHGRPDNVKTYDALKKCGYTGRIVIVIDDLDKKKDEYIKRFGSDVVVFDKKAIAKTFDQADNFNDMRAIVYARNASFEIAKDLGIKYFIQLDDDYKTFDFRFDGGLKYYPPTKAIKNLDRIFERMIDFFEKSGASTIAMAQGGDFIGGSKSPMAKKIKLKRKAMNTFLCSTDRPFQFIGRVNEDVNTYTRKASTGLLMFTMNQISIVQTQTQSSKGGMTELYLDSGTYVKSFYSVMMHPSSVKVKMMQSNHQRLHHAVAWKHTTPMIMRESLRKGVRHVQA
jgi:hypothetical protein